MPIALPIHTSEKFCGDPDIVYDNHGHFLKVSADIDELG